MEKKKIHQDVYIGIACLLLTAIIFFLNRNLPTDAAMMPRLMGGLMGILSVLILISGFRKSGKEFLNMDVVKIPLITWGLIAGYVILFHLVGYFIATAISVVVLMRFMKRRSWPVILLITVVYLAVMYFAFVLQMHVPVNNLGLLGRLL